VSPETKLFHNPKLGQLLVAVLVQKLAISAAATVKLQLNEVLCPNNIGYSNH